MEEKIKEILKKGEMSISDIRDNLGDVNRSQLVGLLRKMLDDEVIFKKVVDDRSYYYLKGNEVKVSDIKFEYNDNRKFENEKYSFDVPDSFEITDEKDRELVAYLPNDSGLPYENGGADVIIFASSYIPIPSDKIKKMIPEVRSTLYEVTFWGAGGDLFGISDIDPEYELVDIGYEVGLITGKFGTQYNFYFICPLKDEYKQMRIVIENKIGSFSELKEMAITLMRGFVSKSKVDDVLALNDEKYMVRELDDKIINEWIHNIKDVDLNIKVLLNLISKSEKNRYDSLKCDRAALEERLHSRLEWVSSIFDRYLIQAYEFILKARENNSDDLLVPIYYNLNLYIGACGELKINLEGKIISEISSKVQDIYYEIFDEKILRMVENYFPSEEEDFYEEDNDDYESIIEDSKKEFESICRDFNMFKDGYLDALEGKMFNSEFSVKLEVNSIKKTALGYGDRLEDLLINIDKNMHDITDNDTILKVKKLVREIFSAFDNLHLDFSTSGLENLDLGSFDYDVSRQVLRIKDFWLKEENVSDNLADILSNEVDEEEEKWEKEVSEINKIINDENSKTIGKELDKLNDEYNASVKEINDEVRQLKQANLDISDEIDGLSKINFRKKDKLNKELEANIQDIAYLEKKLRLLKDDFDKKKENLKKSDDIEDIVLPISPRELLNKIDDLIETEDSLKTYKNNRQYMDDIINELTYISKAVTIQEMMEISDRLSNFSSDKLSSLISSLEKEGRVNKEVISKKAYYSVNEDYVKSYKLNISSDYQFGKDINRVYDVLEDAGNISFNKLCEANSGLSKTRIMQVLYYLIDENKIYMKQDSKVRVCLR